MKQSLRQLAKITTDMYPLIHLDLPWCRIYRGAGSTGSFTGSRSTDEKIKYWKLSCNIYSVLAPALVSMGRAAPSSCN